LQSGAGGGSVGTGVDAVVVLVVAVVVVLVVSIETVDPVLLLDVMLLVDIVLGLVFVMLDVLVDVVGVSATPHSCTKTLFWTTPLQTQDRSMSVSVHVHAEKREADAQADCSPADLSQRTRSSSPRPNPVLLAAAMTHALFSQNPAAVVVDPHTSLRNDVHVPHDGAAGIGVGIGVGGVGAGTVGGAGVGAGAALVSHARAMKKPGENWARQARSSGLSQVHRVSRLSLSHWPHEIKEPNTSNTRHSLSVDPSTTVHMPSSRREQIAPEPSGQTPNGCGGGVVPAGPPPVQ